MADTLHRFRLEGPPGYINQIVGVCSCGQWSRPVPARGAWGNHNSRARMLALKQYHNAHVKAANRG